MEPLDDCGIDGTDSMLRLEEPGVEPLHDCGVDGSDSTSRLSAELDDGEVSCKVGVRLDTLATFDTVDCFFISSINHFRIGQNFHVGSETPGAPLAHLTS